MTTTINPELFDRAADRIFQTGLNKGTYFKDADDTDDGVWPWGVGDKIRETDARCCALGAIAAEAAPLGVDEFDMLNHADFFARTVGLVGNWDIPDWNDAKHRRKADVVKAFRKAADRARAGQE